MGQSNARPVWFQLPPGGTTSRLSGALNLCADSMQFCACNLGIILRGIWSLRLILDAEETVSIQGLQLSSLR